MELNFTSLYTIALGTLKLNRSHPYIERDTRWALHFFFMHGVFTTIFVLVVHNIVNYFKAGDYVEVYAMGVLSVVYFIVTYEYVTMLLFQTTLKCLIKATQNDYNTSKSLPMNEQETVRVYVKKAQDISKLWTCYGILAGLTFPLKSVILMIYYGLNGKFRLVQIFNFVYPDAIERIKDGVLIYMLIFLILSSYVIYGAIMFIGYTLLGPIFLLHACGQLELAKDRLLNMFPKDGTYNPEVAKEKLTNIVVHLQNVYDFVEDINYSFKFLYEMILKGTALAIPILSLQIIEALKKGSVSLEYISILIGAFFMCSMPCYYSDMLMEKGEEVRQAVYACGWQNHADNRMRSTVLLIITRCSRPVVLKTVFNCVSLDALADVLHLAYALFNVMNAAW